MTPQRNYENRTKNDESRTTLKNSSGDASDDTKNTVKAKQTAGAENERQEKRKAGRKKVVAGLRK